MKTIYKVCGGNWGGTHVDKCFLHFINDLLGSEVIKSLKHECRSEYLEFLRTFEFKKRTIDVDSTLRVVLKVPVGFVDVLWENYGTTLQDRIKASPHNSAVSFVGDKLSIEHSLFRSFFQKSVDDIISHIGDIFDDKCCRDLTGIVMVGGFADSTIVNFAMKNAFPERKFIIPLDAG
ncbi:heat shock 70 kDa protein 12A-like [Saccostrea echinata]|uniref:heat shock 70 kDa protein 12A-like n=1 Tax=Saccostrea echinata TaxID=191078 RepID=UPI002A81445F|nr:heat shock 70 kDa protein 12A-like [Saccostrea echinata]